MPPGTGIVPSHRGGQGGLASFGSDPRDWSRDDIRTAGEALKGRWPMSEENREAVVKTLVTIATNPGACGVRESIAAARVLVVADLVNLKEEATKPAGPAMVEASGQVRPDFSKMSDEELERYIHG